MAKGSTYAPVDSAPVLVVVTDPEWEEALIAWANGEAVLRHSDVRVLRTGDGHVASGPAWREATRTGSGLVVVGPVMPGVLTELLFDSPPSPGAAVAVVRPDRRSTSVGAERSATITVGFHGSASASAALRWAVREAAARNAAVRTVLAWSENKYGQTDDAVRIDPHLHHLPGISALMLAESDVAAAGLGGEGIEALARRGTPTRVLTDEAAGSDLLVVGAGRSLAHSRHVCGVTTLGCVSRSPVPVVIVPGDRCGRGRRDQIP